MFQLFIKHRYSKLAGSRIFSHWSSYIYIITYYNSGKAIEKTAYVSGYHQANKQLQLYSEPLIQ